MQGLLRNVKKDADKNLIGLVESFAELKGRLTEEQYFYILRNSVYSEEKAQKIKQTLEELTRSWLDFKEGIYLLKHKISPG